MVNDPNELVCLRRLEHLPELQAKARDANRRLLCHERVGESCVIESPAFARLSCPTVEDGGQRAPAPRFGDPRAMVNLLFGTDYSSARMSYDLRRLRLKGLIERVPAANAYRITDSGPRSAAAIGPSSCQARRGPRNTAALDGMAHKATPQLFETRRASFTVQTSGPPWPSRLADIRAGQVAVGVRISNCWAATSQCGLHGMNCRTRN